ncbi:MAG TPA: GNAT family N-acetyltransferase [Gaiellaceae bacterium]|nr:GNAT family N-acetyltransferase [Gaiellaceae bacterium]
MIRRAETDADFELCARIKSTVEPGQPVTAEELREDPFARLLIHGEAGYAIVKESSLVGCAFTMVRVLPGERRRGVGSALLAACSVEARALGRGSLFGRVDGGDPGSLAWVERRGFAVISQDVEQTRELGEERAPEPPPGIELAEFRPEHLEGVYAVAVDATPDLAVGAEIAARPYEGWLAEMQGRIVVVALEGDDVVGYATLLPLAALPDTLEHELTGVLRSHRRRGIAEALKREQIRWAAAHGYKRLITWTQEGNDAMRNLNLKLGYRERLASLSVKGPVV